MDSNGAVNGPYRATKLWNDVVYAFKSGMPVGRHRRNMKTYETCFVASDAVDWLHFYLKNSPNFGSEVTRYQTIQLLQKFQKAQVYRDVRGNKHNDQFEDNGRLYRFLSSTPTKSNRHRAVLAAKTDNITNIPQSDNSKNMDAELPKQKPEPQPQPDLPKCHLLARPLTKEETETTWKQTTLVRLQTLLGIRNINEILDNHYINSKHLIHNATYISRYGIVNNIPKEDQLPHWILSAMRCLAYWPERVEENLPRYNGFEKDVFNAVREHFQSFQEPLLTFELCDMFLNAFARAERPDPRRSTPHDNHHRSSKDSFLSVENLMMSMASNHSPSPCMQGRFAMSNLDLSQIHKHDDSFSTDYDKRRDYIESCNTSVTGASSFSEPINHYKYSVARGTRRPYTSVSPVKLNTSSLSMHNNRGGYDNFGYNHVSSSCSSSSLRSSHRFYSSNNIYDASNFLEGNLRQSQRRLSRDSIRSTTSEVFNHVKLSRRPCVDPGPVKTSSQYDLNREEESDRITDINHLELWKQRTMYARYKQSNQPPAYRNPPPYNGSYRHGISRVDVTNSSYLTQQDDVDRSVYQTATEPDIPEASIAPQPDWVLNTPKSQKIDASGIFAESRKELINEVLQVCCMCLPPENKRKLHLLLRLMNKMVNNDKLRLDDKIPIRTLVLRTFYKSIIACSSGMEDMDDGVALRLTSTLVDNYEFILSIPELLISDIHNKLAQMKRTKVKYTMEEPLIVSYCEQVSMKEYEDQKLNHSQQALVGLLDNIIESETFSQKEKKKKLKQFQKQYPEIYKQRFPTAESECEFIPQKSKGKSVLFNRLKNIRF